MKQEKYIFQKDTLQYSSYKKNWKQNTPFFLLLFFIGSLIGVLAYALSSKLHLSYDEISLRAKNRELEGQYQVLATQVSQMSTKLQIVENLDDSLYRSLLGQTPLDSTVRKAGRGGHPNPSANYSELIRNTARDINKLDARLILEQQSLIKLSVDARKNADRLLHLPAIMPVSNKDLSYTGSGFGRRYHPILKIWRMHEGIDFISPHGSDVIATADGVVSSARRSRTFGRVIEIDHGYGYKTIYAHLKGFNVKKGQKVARGDVIGWVGNTGLSAGTHLHYEVHKNDREVDPVHYFFKDLTTEEYHAIIEKASSFESSLD